MTDTFYSFYHREYAKFESKYVVIDQLNRIFLQHDLNHVIDGIKPEYSTFFFKDNDPLLIHEKSIITAEQGKFIETQLFKFIIKYFDPNIKHITFDDIELPNAEINGLTKVHGYKAGLCYKIMTEAKTENILLDFDQMICEITFLKTKHMFTKLHDYLFSNETGLYDHAHESKFNLIETDVKKLINELLSK